MKATAFLLSICLFAAGLATAGQDGGPIRVLFLGHEAKHHPSDDYYPMLAQALGPDAIYFDYHTSVEEALGDADFLAKFDAVLLYANHDTIEDHQYQNLANFVENGGGFVPVHCASFCFRNKIGFVRLCGGQFKHHKTGTFTTKIIKPDHPAMAGVKEFEAWDETYVHHEHGDDRNVLMVREPAGADDNITVPEPWTWTRNQGKGRVFYTASGHDQRVWSQAAFHQLLKSGILWAVGEERKKSYEAFLAARTPLKYEKRDNIPNYEKRPEPLPYQLPLSPEDSLAYTQAPVGWRLELFASEPDIVNPIGLAWDERGRLWAAETVDYPNEIKAERKGDDKIKILEDTDGDGRCDKVTVFADGLNIPTSLTFANGGVYLHHAPSTLFLKDTDGDDKADEIKVVLVGWGTGDTHAGPSNLRYGLDNHIWGAVGYSAFNATIGDKSLRFGSGIYRFTKDGSEMEFLHQFNNNTWGLGFNSSGDVFGSTANNNPAFYCGIPAHVLPGGKGMSAKMIATSPKFHPITPNIRQVDVFGGYTAAAGLTFANSDNFPKSWRGRKAFVSGPTGNLLGKFDVREDGAGYVAKNDFPLVASVDEWFSPVAAEVGPDGNLWIADWYNFIIQHNPTPNAGRGGYDAKTGKGNAHENPNRDRQHGRIYRLVWDDAPQSKITTLKNADDETLRSALSDPNQFWRMTAQRLLVDGKREAVAPALKEMVGQAGPGAVHALWTLSGLGKLDPDTHRAALLSPDPVLRRNAVRALPLDESGTALIFQSGVVNDPNKTTRLAAFVALAQLPTNEAIKNAVVGLYNNPENTGDVWLKTALDAAANNHGAKGSSGKFVESEPNLIADAEWTTRNHQGKAEFTQPESEGVGGTSCLKIQSADGADSSWSTVVTAKPGARYRYSAKIKTKGVSGAMGALLNVHELQSPRVVTRALQKDNDWTEVSVDFEPGGLKTFTVNALFGGWGRSKGSAWYDDLRLSELVPVPEESIAGKLEPGDLARGRKIFETHEVAACNRCHMLGGKGGPIGPAMDGIANRKTADYIRQSLLDPNAVIAEGTNLPVSPMPPMDLLLTPQEIEDVLAYLGTLK